MKCLKKEVSRNISIHALREEGDSVYIHMVVSLFISIHALREEGDIQVAIAFLDSFDFYPRPPRGGRLLVCQEVFAVGIISIHALREEGD